MTYQSIKFYMNEVASLAVINGEAGRVAEIHCNRPGGTPWLSMFGRGERIAIDDAPTCDTDTEFRRFVRTRFSLQPPAGEQP